MRFKNEIRVFGIRRHRRRASLKGRKAGIGNNNGLAKGFAWISLRSAALVSICSVLLGIAIPSYVIAQAQLESLPDPRQISLQSMPEDTMVYDRMGKSLIADLHPQGYHRYYRPLKELGKYLPLATIAIEDAHFYEEPGINFQAIIRAGIADVQSHKTVQGASTITQQLIKLRLVGNDPSYSRKLKEAILAYRISKSFSKDQILDMYLNTIFYGNQSYGAEAAAQEYFHTSSTQLSLGQAAFLAGLPQAPSDFDPFHDFASSKIRQTEVLRAMFKNQQISEDEMNKALLEDLSPPTHIFVANEVMSYPDFMGYAIGELRAKLGPDATYKGGLKVITTLDIEIQKRAQQALIDGIARNGSHGISDGAMVAIDPHSGEVLAIVGSVPGAPGEQYNMALWPPRNPGSSMKIFTYTAAIESGLYTMISPVNDAPYKIGDYTPHNYGLNYSGLCELQQCMGNSLNIPAVKVEVGVGVSRVVETARKMGAPPYQGHIVPGHPGETEFRNNDPSNSFTPSLTLGAYGENPFQMATAASVLGAQGVLHTPTGLLVATDGNSSEIYKHDIAKEAAQVVDPKAAFIMEKIMSDNNNRTRVFGTSSPLILPTRQVAAKTGTSEDFADSWTVGYTPSLAVAVWVGNTDWRNKANTDAVFLAAPIWHDFMQSSLDYMNKPNEWFNEPPGLIKVNDGKRVLYFMPGTSPQTRGPVS